MGKRLLILAALLLMPLFARAQFRTPADSLYYSSATRICQNGEVLSHDEVNHAFLARIGNGETRYEEYLKAQKTYRRGWINIAGGVVLTGVFSWLQVKAFQKGGCVSPGGFPFIVGGLVWSGYGIYQTSSASKKVRGLAEELNASSVPASVAPTVTQDGVGIRFSF